MPEIKMKLESNDIFGLNSISSIILSSGHTGA